MIPPKTDERWKRLVSGEIAHEFKIFSASMLISRTSQNIKGNSSFETISESIDEAHSFFTRYEDIFGDDIEAIFG